MKLLYVLENYWPHVGGMETLMGELCKRMATRGHDVTVITRSLPSAPRLDSHDGVSIVRVAAPGGRFAFPIVAFARCLELARTCDVLHTTTFSAAPLGSLVARLTKKPVVLTVPELWIGKWRAFSDVSPASAFLFDLVERSIFAFPFDAYVGISEYTSGRLRAYLARRRAVHTIYCGFDPAPWSRPFDRIAVRNSLGYRDDDFVIVAYGRPGMSKGFRYLVDAFPRIADLIPNARLRLVLSDSAATARDLSKLKRHADSRIVFDRPLAFDRLTEVVRSADCVVVPSLAEGFGYAALETASAGVPLVVSETTSIPEVVGGRYQYSQPRDTDSIVRAVKRVRQNAFVEGEVPIFRWEPAVAAYENLYLEMIEKSS